MRRWTGIAVSLWFAALFSIGPRAWATTPFHIGVVTGTASQSEDDLRGAERLVKEYGSVEAGGMIQHITYSDNFMEQREAYITSVTALADDPLLKAIVVNEAIPGTAEAFQRIKVKRPEIYCLAGEAQEEPSVICPAADMVASMDFVSRGYLIPWVAKQMGVGVFVFASFPRQLLMERFGRESTNMKAACMDLGIKFVNVQTWDPTSDIGLAGVYSQPGIQLPMEWFQKYGPSGEKMAIFCTSTGQIEPLIKVMIRSKNGYFVEADCPHPLMGYPGALGLDLETEFKLDCNAGHYNFPTIQKKLEDVIITKGGAGRFGTWAYSYGYTVSAGLGEYAMRICQGKARRDNLKDLLSAYAKWTPGAGWNGAFYTDGEGRRFNNLALVYQDTYVFGGLNGQHYLRTSKVKVPRKYLEMKWSKPAEAP